MSYFNDEELSKLKASCFRGVARVQLDALNFHHPLVLHKSQKLSQKNVHRIRKIFEKVGCLRLQEGNFINAFVDDASLDYAAAKSQVSRNELLGLSKGQELPLLHSVNVECLSGLHRIEAAKAFLDENDQWWTVRMFSRNMPEPALARIVESFSNEQRPSDGEIVRNILLYRRLCNEFSENQWWAHIDHSKPKDLRQLLKNRPVAAAFESLADMPGLWAKFQLGTLHRLLALKCDEEMILYLKHIERIWSTIVTCGDTILPYSAIDDITAERLEGLCPKHCAADKDSVVAFMRDRVIFPSVVDEGLRRALLTNITNISSLIPSLWTFFETLKLLEPLCDILRRLIGAKMKGTIRRSLLACFFPPPQNRMQKSEKYYIECRAQLDQVKAAELAYVQLWAFCGRHFDQLSNFAPRKVIGKDKPVVVEQNPLLWQHLATFASDLGFRVPNATQLAEQQSRSKLAIDYLKKANPLSNGFSAAQIERVVLAGSLPEGPPKEVPELSATPLVKERRFGRTFGPDLEEDKHHLFIPTIYQEQDFPVVNLQFIRYDLFRCIFAPFSFLNHDFGPPKLYIPSAGRSPLAGTEMIEDIRVRKRAEPEDESAECAQKRRRLEHETNELNGEIQQLLREVVCLGRENRSLRDESAELRSRVRVSGSLREMNVDTNVGGQMFGTADASGIDQVFFVPASQAVHEQLVEQQFAQQLQDEQRQAEQVALRIDMVSVSYN